LIDQNLTSRSTPTRLIAGRVSLALGVSMKKLCVSCNEYFDEDDMVGFQCCNCAEERPGIKYEPEDVEPNFSYSEDR